MTLEKLTGCARDLLYFMFATATGLAAWYYSKESGKFDGLSLLLCLHAISTAYHWWQGSYGKLGPAERISLEIELDPPSKDDVMDEVQRRR